MFGRLRCLTSQRTSASTPGWLVESTNNFSNAKMRDNDTGNCFWHIFQIKSTAWKLICSRKYSEQRTNRANSGCEMYVCVSDEETHDFICRKSSAFRYAKFFVLLPCARGTTFTLNFIIVGTASELLICCVTRPYTLLNNKSMESKNRAMQCIRRHTLTRQARILSASKTWCWKVIDMTKFLSDW